MINMFSHVACFCYFVFYVLLRASYGYIHGVGLFPVQSVGSLNIFPAP